MSEYRLKMRAKIRREWELTKTRLLVTMCQKRHTAAAYIGPYAII